MTRIRGTFGTRTGSLPWPRAAGPPLVEPGSQDHEGDEDDRNGEQAEQDLDDLDEDEQRQEQHQDEDEPSHRSVHLVDLDGLRTLPERAPPNLSHPVTPAIIWR